MDEPIGEDFKILRMKTFSIIFVIMLIYGCGSEKITTTNKTLIVHDTLIRHESKIVRLPVRQVNIIENPCREQPIKPIDQVIEIAGIKSIVKTDSIGDITHELITPKQETITVQETKIRDRVETNELSETIKTGRRSRKWFWRSLLLNIILIGWIFRKPVQSGLKRIISPI